MQNLTQNKLGELHAELLKQVLDVINKKIGKDTDRIITLVCEDVPGLSYSSLSDIVRELNTQEAGLRMESFILTSESIDGVILQPQSFDNLEGRDAWIVRITDVDKYMNFYNNLNVEIKEDKEDSQLQKPTNITAFYKPNWTAEQGKHMGILKLPDEKPLEFRGSFFGGLNILFSNFSESVAGKLLREEIKKANLRNGYRSYTISNWKYELKRNRPLFFKYYDLVKEDNDRYRLIYKPS
jgi:hypothetical protein